MTALEFILSAIFLSVPFALDWRAVSNTGETRGLFAKAVFADVLAIVIIRLF